jgi:hypothetical protein
MLVRWLSGKRTDGDPIRDEAPVRQLMPYLMPTRNESVVYFEQVVDLSRTLPFLGQLGPSPDQSVTAAAALSGKQVNLFHLILAAVVRILCERPQLNRFVVGSRLYQRRHIELSFAIKKERSDRGELTTTKLRFTPEDSLSQIAEKCRAAVEGRRSGPPSQSEREVALITRLPGFLIRLLLYFQRLLDGWNLLPAALIEPDPLYASMFLANLGSIGLESAYHHLYEYGTVSLFLVVGRMEPKTGAPAAPETTDAAQQVRFKFSFDERITDGYYCARSLERFRVLVEDPASWARL